MANNVLVGYSPNDFYYVQAEQSNELNESVDCNNLKIYGNTRVYGNTIVNDGTITLPNGTTIISGNVLALSNPLWDSICTYRFSDNSGNCLKRELCNNKTNATKLEDLQNTKLGAMEKFMNEKMNYDSILMNTINLGIGIVFLIVVIYKNQK
jgi:hypothetical protein